MTVSEGPGTLGSRVLSKNYPAVEGIEAGTTKQKTESVFPEPETNLTPFRYRKGL